MVPVLPYIDPELEKIILEQGPYTVEELKNFPEGKYGEYILAMQHQLQIRGLEEFRAERDMLRRGTEAQILRDPPNW